MVVRKPTFNNLVSSIRHIHETLLEYATKAVNVSLSLRNWLIGYYIAEYELHGSDRANYGKNLFSELSKRLQTLHVSNCRHRQLYYYVTFYRTYPQIVRTVSAQLRHFLPKAVFHSKKVFILALREVFCYNIYVSSL